ncbi:MAG: glycoside hydrolase family 9 protein [Actinomycetota bacterium]|nr:glycoside hydrolase family 9 protein [Actinomycetota bacterium]
MNRRRVAIALVAAAVAVVALSPAGAHADAFVRLDQVGYPPTAPKRALLMSSRPASGAFQVVDQTGRPVLSGRAGRRLAPWSAAFRYVYALDFGRLSKPGTYRLLAAGATSPPFAIAPAADLYAPLVRNAVAYFRAHRAGPGTDPTTAVYRPPRYVNGRLRGRLVPTGAQVDLGGGWWDAGDYLRLVQTASFDDALLLFALREHPGTLEAAGAKAEAQVGLDWLTRAWDDRHRVLRFQVGIGDGGPGVLGLHDVWQLPGTYAAAAIAPGDERYFVAHPPAFAQRAPLSPNLAGRLAADFGLCAQVLAASDPARARRCLQQGEAAFAAARTSHVRELLTTVPHAYYPETEWRDDLELGAVELHLAAARLGRRSAAERYLRAAASWANAYLQGPGADVDTLNLYDVTGLAHYELGRALGARQDLAVTRAGLLDDMRTQLVAGAREGRDDPFGLTATYRDGDAVPHALGYALEGRLYDRLAGNRTWEATARRQLDWAFGANPWGTSFVVGAGSTFPHCLHDQLANLTDSLDGQPPLLLGATVGGPDAASDFRGLEVASGARSCPTDGRDPFARFSGRGARYQDAVVASPSVEPAGDYTAVALAALADATT